MIDRIIPGTSVEVVAGEREAVFGAVGVVAMPLTLSWGDTLTRIRQRADTLTTLGYRLYDPAIKLVTEVMKYANELYLYRLNAGIKATGLLAEGITAEARYGGERGNDITVTVTSADDKWLIKTYLGTQEMDSQIVAAAADFRANDFVVIAGEGVLTAKTLKLTGGGNGADADLSGFITEISKHDYNILVYTGTDSEAQAQLKSFVQEERINGRNVQCVMSGVAADDPAIYNSTVGLVYPDYVLSAPEACATMGAILAKQGVIGSATYFDVVGAVDVSPRLTKLQQEVKTQAGEILFVYMYGGVKVLYDINSLTSYTDKSPRDFGKGLVMRTLDQYDSDLQTLLNTKAIGKIRNNVNGRNQIKGMIYDMTVSRYLDRGYIEGFTADDITVSEGTARDSVVVTVGVRVTDTVDKIYVTVTAL